MEELIYNIVSEIVEHKDEIKIEKFVKNTFIKKYPNNINITEAFI